MDNNEIYVNEVIEAYLNSKEEMKTLDEVTVKSLFRTCIETINPELPHSSVIIRGIRKPDKTYSIKLKNIKMNFNFALDMIIGLGSVYEGSKIMLIWLILDVLRTFFSEVSVELVKDDAYLIYVIYKLDYTVTGIKKEQLEDYFATDTIAKQNGYFTEPGKLEESLDRMLKIHSITEQDGGYHISETILN